VPSPVVPTKWSDTYRKQIAVNLQFQLLGELANFQVWFFNGESIYHFPAKKQQHYVLERMPEKVLAHWVKDNGDTSMSAITLDEQSIFAAYEKLSISDANIHMIIQLREYDDTIRAWLKSKNEIIEIQPQS
jgi:hypothetical protein